MIFNKQLLRRESYVLLELVQKKRKITYYYFSRTFLYFG